MITQAGEKGEVRFLAMYGSYDIYLEKLKDPEVAETFKAMIGGKFAPLALLDADDVNMDDLINKFNVAVTETANETLGKYRHKKQPWVTPDIFHYATSAES